MEDDLAEQYKDDFESLSTRDVVSSSSSSNTVTHVRSASGGVALEEDTMSPSDSGVKRGFALSPIHTVQMSPKSDLGSTSGNSSLVTDIRPTEDTESRPPANLVATSGSLYAKGDTRLLKGRSSKPSLLPSEHPPPMTVPTSSILPQKASSSTESSVTANSSDQTRRLTPLAPISTDHGIKYSESVHKVESIAGSLKNESILKPLQTEKASSKPSAAESGKYTTSGAELKKYDVPVLSSASTEGMAAGHSDCIENSTARAGRLTSASTHHANVTSNDTAVDTLTVVTDIAASPLGGDGTDSELSRAHGALVAAEPKLGITEKQSETSTHLHPAGKSARDQVSTESECSESGSPCEGGVALRSDLPGEDLAYDGLNIQELIRAITGEELASMGREILQGSSPRQEVSPTAPVVKDIRKLKRTGSAPGESSRTNRKPELSGISKLKTHLSRSRESLTSNPSLRKPAGASAVRSRTTKARNVGKDNSTTAAGATRQASKRSGLPQRAAKPSGKIEECGQTAKTATKAATKPATRAAKSSHGQTKEARDVGPGSLKGEFDSLSGLGGKKADAVPSDSPQRNAVTVESLRKKVWRYGLATSTHHSWGEVQLKCTPHQISKSAGNLKYVEFGCQ